MCMTEIDNSAPVILDVALLAGDGIGPEVMREAVRVLRKIEELSRGRALSGRELRFSFHNGLVGGAAYDVYNCHLPNETLEICQAQGAILFGSVGGDVQEARTPKWHNCEVNSILTIRKHFGFFANFRPVKLFPELAHASPLKREIVARGIDILIIRELNGDIYFGEHVERVVDGERIARDSGEYTATQIANVAHLAFKAAGCRQRRVMSVDKANVLQMSRLWRQVVGEVAVNYSDVALEHILVDNCAMQLTLNPDQFDVILAPNMFGDILSDEAAAICGTIGMLPSASFNERGFALYEPAGGSAPSLAGKNVANPIAQILSAAMMLRYSFKLEAEALLIEKAVQRVIADGWRTADIYRNTGSRGEERLVGTEQMGDAICRALDVSEVGAT